MDTAGVCETFWRLDEDAVGVAGGDWARCLPSDLAERDEEEVDARGLHCAMNEMYARVVQERVCSAKSVISF